MMVEARRISCGCSGNSVIQSQPRETYERALWKFSGDTGWFLETPSTETESLPSALFGYEDRAGGGGGGRQTDTETEAEQLESLLKWVKLKRFD